MMAARNANSLHGVAAKILEAVPIQDAWTPQKIGTEVFRATGSRVDPPIVLGCLNSLKEQGLIREPMAQLVTRIPPPAEKKALRVVEASPPSLETPATPPGPAAETADPLVEVGTLSARLRAAAADLLRTAEDLERVGLAFEAKVDAAKAGNKKVRDMQQLLRSLLDDEGADK